MFRKVGPRARLALLLLLVAAGSAAVAIPLVLRSAPKCPPSPREGYQDLFDTGLTSLRARLFLPAIQRLERARQIDPRQPLAYYHLAWAYFQVGEFEKAREMLDLILERPEIRRYAEALPRFHFFYLLRGEAAYSLGDYERSKADILKAIELKPGDGVMYDQLSQTYMALGEFEHAMKAALEASELGYRNHESTFRVGMALKRLGRHEEAERFFRESILLSPGYTRAYQNLAQSLLRLGKKEESKRTHEMAKRLAQVDDQIKHFRKYLINVSALGESHRKTMEAYAQYCIENGKYARLSECMPVLVRVYPQRADYHVWRGLASARLQDEGVAEEHLRRALEIRPGKVAAMNLLALLLAGARDPEVRNPEESVFWAEKARSAGYADPEVLAVALDAAGRTEEAERLVEWKIEGRSGWEIHRELELKRFQEALLERPVKKLFPDRGESIGDRPGSTG